MGGARRRPMEPPEGAAPQVWAPANRPSGTSTAEKDYADERT